MSNVGISGNQRYCLPPVPVRERTDTGVLARRTKVPEMSVDVRSL